MCPHTIREDGGSPGEKPAGRGKPIPSFCCSKNVLVPSPCLARRTRAAVVALMKGTFALWALMASVQYLPNQARQATGQHDSRLPGG